MNIRIVSYEDWIQLFSEEKLVYEGHSIPDHVWIDFITKLQASDLPVTKGCTVNFEDYGAYFAYNGTPKDGFALQREIDLIKRMEKKGYTCDEDGNWIKV